ncbi:hypothetical protein Agub_g3391, partial [Astrephomene gubernaculifera]
MSDTWGGFRLNGLPPGLGEGAQPPGQGFDTQPLPTDQDGEYVPQSPDQRAGTERSLQDEIDAMFARPRTDLPRDPRPRRFPPFSATRNAGGAAADAAPAPAAAAPAPAPVAAAAVAPVRADEVLKVDVPVPKLNLDDRIEARDIPVRTRAFIRDIHRYFELVRGGHLDSVRCLCLANVLEGRAKRWHDEWTLARTTYTSRELLDALLVRFAPQIRSRETEARQKLASGRYRMR